MDLNRTGHAFRTYRVTARLYRCIAGVPIASKWDRFVTISLYAIRRLNSVVKENSN